MPNIILLIQAVIIQIFSSQCPIWLKCLSLKRGIIQSNIHRILRKVNQVICIMYPNCTPDIMILAQAVSRYFVDNIALQYKMPKSEKGHNSNTYRILPKVNQVIYTLDITCMSNIMILDQAVLQIFCWQGSLGYKLKNVHNSATTNPTKKKMEVCLIFMLVLYIEFQDPTSNGSWPYAKVTDRQAQTNNCPLNGFFQVEGIKYGLVWHSRTVKLTPT